ncbi:heavy metal-associated isoprenylated plant protein 28-like [Juglans regia]|uniref:Heavy metal-associated isoprenylated plant protein 28-like n=2 Tax=Juglans regia TaxID=51240 RepID=A0A2I4G3J5_JUGRE|nr:heavy metal-associated isoprenylated plant protein 28-like [Juglans regia]
MSIVEMIVHMDCTGCERKIKKALRKLDGVNEVDIDMVTQKVTVMGWIDQDKVLKTVRKTGRRADLWPYPHDPDYYNIISHYYHQNRPLVYNTSHSSTSYSYDDYMHGYDNRGYVSYQQPSYPTTYDKDWPQATTMFNDDNPHACSIM